jgi:hypothetical protein
MLVQELSEHTTNVHIQDDALDGMFTLYDGTKATLNVYHVCKRLQDLWCLFILSLDKWILRF